jgi:hypothetical protein
MHLGWQLRTDCGLTGDPDGDTAAEAGHRAPSRTTRDHQHDPPTG